MRKVQEDYSPNVPLSAAEGAIGGLVVLGVLMAGWFGRALYEASHTRPTRNECFKSRKQTSQHYRQR